MWGYDDFPRQDNHDEEYLDCINFVLSQIQDQEAELKSIKEKFPKISDTIHQKYELEKSSKVIAHPSDPTRKIASLEKCIPVPIEGLRGNLHSTTKLQDGTWVVASDSVSGHICKNPENPSVYKYQEVSQWPGAYSVLRAGKLLFFFPPYRKFKVFKKEIEVHEGRNGIDGTIMQSHMNTTRNIAYYEPLNYVYYVGPQNKLICVDIGNEFEEVKVFDGVGAFSFYKDKVYVLQMNGNLTCINHKGEKADENKSSEEPLFEYDDVRRNPFMPGSLITIDDNSLLATATNLESDVTDFYIIDPQTLKTKGSLKGWIPMRGVRLTPVLWLKMLPRSFLPKDFLENINLVLSCHSTDMISLIAIVNSTSVIPVNALKVQTPKGYSGIDFMDILEGEVYLGMGNGDLMQVEVKF